MVDHGRVRGTLTTLVYVVPFVPGSISVQVIYLLTPLALAVCSGIATRMARRIGRVTVLVFFKVSGILLLVAMAFLKDWVAADHPPAPNGTLPNGTLSNASLVGYWELDSSRRFGGVGAAQLSRTLKIVLMVAIYIARTTLMNCTYPLEEAILMDYVPKETRARWKSLDSIMVFGWCGSAAVGGIIADAYDYSTTFLVTAALQAAGTLVFAYLWVVIPQSKDVEGGTDAPAPAAPSGVLVEPLAAGSIQQPAAVADAK